MKGPGTGGRRTLGCRAWVMALCPLPEMDPGREGGCSLETSRRRQHPLAWHSEREGQAGEDDLGAQWSKGQGGLEGVGESRYRA